MVWALGIRVNLAFEEIEPGGGSRAFGLECGA